ncbi:MAG: sulfatase-like hydrolase/transferase, partial [Actinobacteria bacterium]|nr:sulfatase-like hydrolase/transferase [Actinomycetota bacterium]
MLVTLGIAGDFDPVSAQASARPNILIILTDDQRATGTMWVMPKTRAIFGSGGTRYNNAVATTPLCCPSRASIFSGRYAHNHGVVSNASAGALNQDLTIQAQLRRAGYRTAVAGKFLNGFPSSPPHFDRWAVHRGRRYFDATFDLDGIE